jgi:hypothetical protein
VTFQDFAPDPHTWPVERVRGLESVSRGGAAAAIPATFRRAAAPVGFPEVAPGEPVVLSGFARSARARARQRLPATPGRGIRQLRAGLSARRPLRDRARAAAHSMPSEPVLQGSRLGLLRSIVDNFAGLTDLTRLSRD